MEDIVKEACIRDLKAHVGDSIRMARLSRRMSQRELSELTGITETTICKIERGDTDVKLSSLALIRSALALDITIAPM